MLATAPRSQGPRQHRRQRRYASCHWEWHMEHGSIRACGYCKQDKAWINSGKKLKDGSKVYVDENGLRWSGRRCPECERSRVYAAVRCDSFERDIIIRQFEENGFSIESRTLPLKVKKDGQTF